MLTEMGEFFVRKQDHDLWSTLDNEGSLRRYSDVGVQILAAAMRTLERLGKAEVYQLPMTAGQILQAKQVLSGLQSETPNGGIQYLTKIHECFWKLLTESIDASGKDKFMCPIYCYLAVYGFRQDGTFKSAHELTQVLAIVKYLIRSAVLFEACRDIPGDNEGVPE
jgi:hypothetical protein